MAITNPNVLIVITPFLMIMFGAGVAGFYYQLRLALSGKKRWEYPSLHSDPEKLTEIGKYYQKRLLICIGLFVLIGFGVPVVLWVLSKFGWIEPLK